MKITDDEGYEKDANVAVFCKTNVGMKFLENDF
jgi:hypothetical protein